MDARSSWIFGFRYVPNSPSPSWGLRWPARHLPTGRPGSPFHLNSRTRGPPPCPSPERAHLPMVELAALREDPIYLLHLAQTGSLRLHDLTGFGPIASSLHMSIFPSPCGLWHGPLGLHYGALAPYLPETQYPRPGHVPCQLTRCLVRPITMPSSEGGNGPPLR